MTITTLEPAGGMLLIMAVWDRSEFTVPQSLPEKSAFYEIEAENFDAGS